MCIAFCTARVTTASKCVEGAGSHSSISTAVPSIDNCFDEHSNMGNEIQQSWQEAGTTPESGVQQVSRNTTCECAKDRETLLCEQQTGQLVKEVRIVCLSACTITPKKQLHSYTNNCRKQSFFCTN